MKVDSGVLMRRLGTFWSARIPDTDRVSGLMGAWAIPLQDALDRMEEELKALDVAYCARPARTRRLRVTAKLSDIKLATKTIGSGEVGGSFLGETETWYEIPIPAGVAEVLYLQSDLDCYGAVKLAGKDFYVKPKRLLISRIDDLPTSGTGDDAVVHLWLIGVRSGNPRLRERWGEIVNPADKLPQYSERTHALWRALVSGPATIGVKQLMAAACGGYLCQRAQAVEAVSTSEVITSDAVLPKTLLPSAEVGDVLEAGTLLGPVSLVSLASWPVEMAGVEIDSSWQNAYGTLRAANQEEPTVITGDSVTFPLAGPGASAFFSALNARGDLLRLLGRTGTVTKVNPAKILLCGMEASAKVIIIRDWESRVALVEWLLKQALTIWPSHVGMVVVLDGDNNNFGRSAATTLRRLEELKNA